MILGKLLRLSLMLVKSLVFNFLRGRGCLLHPFSFLIRKKQRKDKINVCRFAYNKINAYLCNVIKKQPNN